MSHEPRLAITFTLDGRRIEAGVRPGDRLLRLLRGIGAHSVKYGCDTGECGACTVLLDGEPILACLYPAVRVDGRTLTTVASLGHTDALDPLQAAFLAHGAVQCGYCTPAMLLAARALLAHDPSPNETAIRTALATVLCRCTGYSKPVAAIAACAAARTERAAATPGAPTPRQTVPKPGG